MTDIKQAIEILETMCAEPEDGQEERLEADELDAVLLALKLVKAYTQRFGKWQYMNGGNYKCKRCQSYALHKTNYCPNCGAVMTSEVTT